MLSLTIEVSVLGYCSVRLPKTASAALNIKEQEMQDHKLNSNVEKFVSKKLGAANDGNDVWNYDLIPNSRICGIDRYGTAADIVSKGKTMFSDYAIVATGENYADALCAAPLARKYNAPILFTNTASLNENAKKELIDCKIKNVIIVGGTGAVSQNTENQIKALGMTITRIAGINRYDTSVKIAQKLGKIEKITVATGNDYPDALSIATIAAIEGMPILLTDKDSIPTDTMTYINNNKNVSQTYVVGGTGVISDTVSGKLVKSLRLAGANRYETNTKILNYFRSDLDMAQVFLATGRNFPDALACSALSPFIKSPIVLTELTPAKETVSYINNNITSIGQVVAVGGTGVVPDSLLNNAQNNFNVPYSNPEIKFNDTSVDFNVRYRLKKEYEKLYQRDVNKIICLSPGEIKDISDIEKTRNLLCLNLSNNGLTDISGMKNLINLEYLYLSGNKITNISALSNLVNLRNIDLYGNGLSDIKPLKALTKLQDVDLIHNNVSDVSPLSGHTNLQTLDLMYNKVSDISPLSNCLNLRDLDLYRNSVSNINALKGLMNLENIDFEFNNITDISPLKGHTNLTKIWFYGNSVKDISVLSGLTNLEGVDFNDNGVGDISPLKGLTKLKSLELGNNNISNISILSNLTNLERLDLWGNKISDLTPLSGMTKLETIDLWCNNVSDISVFKKFTNMGYVNLRNNPISDISPLKGLAKLEYLFMGSNNKIKDISALAGDTNLMKLELFENQITDISAVKNMTNLIDLNLGGNLISDVSPLSGLTNLNELYISNNSISDISALRGMTRLATLSISNNKISNITPLIGLSKLTELYIYNNNISAADQTKLKIALPNCDIKFTTSYAGIVKKEQDNSL